MEISPRKTIDDATCTRCGCLCDDITLVVVEDRIVEAKADCPLGEAWFLSHAFEPRPACLIGGQPASVDEGVVRAAEILTRARFPLVYGLSDTTCEAQQMAVAIADWIGGTVDTTASLGHGRAIVGFQAVGKVTATLGEVRHRADLVIYWGGIPTASHPRHTTKYSLMPKGAWVPRGREDRTCVVVDVPPAEHDPNADLFLSIRPQADFEALATLRALAKGLPLDPAAIESQTGVPLAAWQDLIDRMKRARFGAIFFGEGLTASRGGHLNAEALLALTRDMNAHTRFVCLSITGHGNVTGADNVLAWRTGFPFGVNLSRGYPRFSPGEYTACDMLGRREADAALILAADPLSDFPPAARDHLASLPYVALGSQETATTRQATVAFAVATFGINVPGTVYRMDDVALPLRPAVASPLPSDLEILARLERRIRGR